jgi:hypothetical protein
MRLTEDPLGLPYKLARRLDKNIPQTYPQTQNKEKTKKLIEDEGRKRIVGTNGTPRALHHPRRVLR